MDFSVKNLVPISENTTVDRVDNSEVDGAKVSAKTTKSKSHNKNKGKNLVKSFLAKS